MKKVLNFNLLLVLLFVAVIVISCGKDHDGDRRVSPDTLPESGQNFISEHFPDITISYLERNNSADEDGVLYEAYLTNGFEVDFSTEGVWINVDGGRNAILASILALLPEALNTYLAQTYPNVAVVEVQKKTYGYKIELINDVDLKFNSDGAFIAII